VKGPATTVVERPPPGPAQGSLPAPAWLVAALSLALALLAIFGVLKSFRKPRRP
jgi:hypothetical protein